MTEQFRHLGAGFYTVDNAEGFQQARDHFILDYQFAFGRNIYDGVKKIHTRYPALVSFTTDHFEAQGLTTSLRATHIPLDCLKDIGIPTGG